MKNLLIFFGALMFLDNLLPICFGKPASDTYSTKYDNFDVQGVLASKRLVARYGDCLLERGSCTPEGRFLKGE